MKTMTPLFNHKQRNILYYCLKVGGISAIAIMAIGSVLSAANVNVHITNCQPLFGFLRGIIHFYPHCWFTLGIITIMSVPVFALFLITGFAIRLKDYWLIIITIIIYGLIFGALVHPF